jgi:hypothetical protein
MAYFEQSIAESQSKSNMAVDSQGNLYVPDYWNNRILRYNAQPSGPVTSTEPASHVWGQPDMFSYATNDIGGNTSGQPSAQNLYLSPLNQGHYQSYASGVAIDTWGNLWVTDSINNRVLRFPNSGGVTGIPSNTADVVLGQTGMAITTATTLYQPMAVRVDGAGNVYVVSYTGSSDAYTALYVYQPVSIVSGVPFYDSNGQVTPNLTLSMPGTIGNQPYGLEWDAPNNAPTSQLGIGGAPAPGQSGGLWVSGQSVNYRGYGEDVLFQITLSSGNQISTQVVKSLLNDAPGSSDSLSGDHPITFTNPSGDSINGGYALMRNATSESLALDA